MSVNTPSGVQYKYYKYNSDKGSYEGTDPVPQNQCASYNNTEKYQCPSHRSPDETRRHVYHEFLSGDIIDNTDINQFIDSINEELTIRKNCALYNGFYGNQISRVNSGYAIDSNQPNTISSILATLNKYIKKIDDRKFGDISKPETVEDYPILSGKICEPRDLSVLYQPLSGQYIDCVCYADCTEYGYEWRCNCYGNCGCHY